METNGHATDATSIGAAVLSSSRSRQPRWTREQVQPYEALHPEADLDALELNLLLAFAESARKAAMVHRWAAVGLSKAGGQYTVLKTLLFYKEFTHSELARHIRVTLSNVTRLVDQMQDSGWIERRGDPTDKRLTYVRLTPKGEDLARRLVADSVQFTKDVTECFSHGEILMFIEFLSRLHDQAEALDVESVQPPSETDG